VQELIKWDPSFIGPLEV